MSNLINLTFENTNPIRIIDQNGDFWFVANDVCNILEIQNTTDALKALDDDEKAKLEVSPSFNLGLDHRAREINIINESGLYALILRSRKAMQKGTVQHKFRKWVTSEVLPSIRKTGTYRHTLSPEQKGAIRAAIAKRCKSDSIHYQTLYAALHAHCGGVNSYHEILACDFDKALDFIHGYQFAPVVDAELYQVLTDCFEHIRDHARIAHLMSAPHATRINDTLNSIIHLAHTMALTNRHGRPMFERIGYEKRMNYYSGNALIMH